MALISVDLSMTPMDDLNVVLAMDFLKHFNVTPIPSIEYGDDIRERNLCGSDGKPYQGKSVKFRCYDSLRYASRERNQERGENLVSCP